MSNRISPKMLDTRFAQLANRLSATIGWQPGNLQLEHVTYAGYRIVVMGEFGSISTSHFGAECHSAAEMHAMMTAMLAALSYTPA